MVIFCCDPFVSLPSSIFSMTIRDSLHIDHYILDTTNRCRRSFEVAHPGNSVLDCIIQKMSYIFSGVYCTCCRFSITIHSVYLSAMYRYIAFPLENKTNENVIRYYFVLRDTIPYHILAGIPVELFRE